MSDSRVPLRPRGYGSAARLTGLATFVAIACLTDVAGAQGTTATILGRTLGPDGSGVPGVTVSATNVDTNAERVAATAPDGTFEIPLLPPGDYRLEASGPGFKTYRQSGIRLRVNQRALLEIALQIGDISEEITVIADVPLLDRSSSAIGTVIDNEKIEQLPLNARDFFQLSTLVTGSFQPAEGSQNSTQGGAVAINGAREQSNNFMLDGLDNNDLSINQIAVPPSMDAIEEFKVVSSTYGAEFGRSAGGQFNYVTKSGTNRWRGSLFEFHRDDSLDARNFFDDPDLPQPEFRRDQYGGTIGGPIAPDRTFVFGSYERTRVKKGFTRVATVPPLAWRDGDFSSQLTGIIDPATGFDLGQLFDPRTGQPFAGNLIPTVLIDPAGRAILDFYPAPDAPGARGPASATVSPIGRSDVHQASVRIDHHASGNDRLFARYAFWTEDRFNPFDPLVDPTNVPGFGSFTENSGHNVAVGWTRAIGDDAYLDARVGFNRARGGIFQEHRGNDVASQLGIDGLPTDPLQVGRPGVVLGITDALIEPTNAPQERRNRTWQAAASYSRLTGAHSIKAGFDVRHVALDAFLDILARGQFVFAGVSGNPVADLLLGFPLLALRPSPEGISGRQNRTYGISGYVQDSWAVSDRLTVDLGLRYEFNRPPVEVNDLRAVPQFDDPAGSYLQVGRGGIPRAGFPADANNLAPRVGFAWQPAGLERTVVRGGYGIYYDVGLLNSHVLTGFNPPFKGLDLAFFPGSLQNAFAGPAAPIQFVFGISDAYKDPWYHQFSLGMQQELASDWIAELAYVGSRGRNLIREIDPNQGPEGGPPVRNPAFGPSEVVVTTGRSSYDSLQFRLERRFRDGLGLLAAYTLSRSRDDGSALFGAAATAGTSVPQNSFDPGAEWGPSDFDTPHRLVVSATWELPFGPGKPHLNDGGLLSDLLGGWQLAGIATVQSGRPFTVYYGASANFSGTSNGANGGFAFDRPDQIGDPEITDQTPERWFDTGAFAPPDNAFGNVGRNTLRGDGIQNIDVGLYRNLELGGERTLQVRFEVFNLLNEAHFFLPVADLTSAAAGRVVRAADGRQVQLGVRLAF